MASRASRFTTHLRPVLATFAIVALAACPPPRATNSEPEFRASVSGVEWELVELDGKTPPTGAGGRRATIRFDADTSRAGGFSGCNRFGGTYSISGDSLRFGPIAMTRMACTEGMELESALSAALQATQRYELSATQLKLFGQSGPVARFSRQIPEPDRSPDT